MTPEQLAEIEKWVKAGECDPEDMANVCAALREAWAVVEAAREYREEVRSALAKMTNGASLLVALGYGYMPAREHLDAALAKYDKKRGCPACGGKE